MTKRTNNINISEVLDQYYTKETVAVECCKALTKLLGEDFFSDKTFLEPSAGTGAFVKAVKNVIGQDTDILAYDVEPKYEGIIRHDFLTLELGRKHLVTCGNPPFGRRSKLAIDFFNKCAEVSDVIAFIVPNQFAKYSVHSKLDADFNLIYSESIASDSFEFNGKNASIGCVFQVWSRELYGKKDLRIREKPATSHDDFELYQYNAQGDTIKYFDKNQYGWDFAVPRQGFRDYEHMINDPRELDPHTQYMFVKANNDAARRKLMGLSYKELSRRNTTIPGFGKADVVMAYNGLAAA